jgi:hypothetical protein
MSHGDGERDASEWTRRAHAGVVAMVRKAIRNKPTTVPPLAL